MDLETAESQLDAFIERRARALGEEWVGQRHANDPDAFWRASERRHREKKRRANAALWYTHYKALASALRRSAERYERRAEALSEEEGP